MVALTLALLAATPVEGPGDVYAVVVGHNGGLSRAGAPPLTTLKFADDDALRLARWFSPLVAPNGLFLLATPDAETLGTLTAMGVVVPGTRPPTRRALLEVFAQLKATLAARTRPATVFFYYAGHGLTGRLLLEREGGDEAGLTGTELKLALGELGAEHVEVFIDACRSQSLFTERGPDLSAEIAQLEAKAGATTFGVLTAAQSDKPAGEASDLRGGFFSHVLASGLAGAADADGDEVVRFGELAAFVAFNTQGLTGQRPWFEAPAGDLATPVIRLSGTTRMALGEDTHGRFRVSSEKGLPIVAELFKEKGRAMALTLPTGRYVVERRDGPELAADIELSSGETKTLGPLVVPRPRPSERGELAWEPVSFQAPFSPQVVAALDAGYVSGRPVAPVWNERFAVQLGVVLGPAPFGLVGMEQAFEVGGQYRFGRVAVGLRAGLRRANAPTGTVSRVALNAFAGWRWSLAERMSLTPFVTAGTKTIWLASGSRLLGDPLAPSAGGGAQLEWRALSWLGVWLDARAEVTFVALDGVRTAFFEPSAVVGGSLWF